jgi:hypothetical protein
MQLDFPKPKIVKEITDILMIVGLRETAAGTIKTFIRQLNSLYFFPRLYTANNRRIGKRYGG